MASTKKKATRKKTGKTREAKKTPTLKAKKEKRKKVSPKAKKTRAPKKTKTSVPSGESLPRKEAIKAIKAELLKQKRVLIGEAGATINNMPDAVLYPDMGDQAEMEIERNFLLRLRGREQRLLKKIDEALERIEDGTFGLCEVCGKEIDIRRLMARPVTTMCIECKIEQEEEERLREM